MTVLKRTKIKMKISWKENKRNNNKKNLLPWQKKGTISFSLSPSDDNVVVKIPLTEMILYKLIFDILIIQPKIVVVTHCHRWFVHIFFCVLSLSRLKYYRDFLHIVLQLLCGTHRPSPNEHHTKKYSIIS